MTDQDAGVPTKQALLQAAYDRIAQDGFEGLRTRDVAADVGVNVATLHYHFPTKEALIRAVVGQAMAKFGATLPRDGSPIEQLAAHFRGLRALLANDPKLWAVMGELATRAPRDPTLAGLLRDMDAAWHHGLTQLLRRALAAGGLNAGLEPEGAAAVIVATMRGVALPAFSGTQTQRLDQALGQLERWLGLPSEHTS